MAFPLRIFSIDREVFIGQVHSVTVPGTSGQMQVLPDHMPLVSLLKEGDIIIEAEGQTAAPELTLMSSRGTFLIHQFCISRHGSNNIVESV